MDRLPMERSGQVMQQNFEKNTITIIILLTYDLKK